MPDIKKQTNKTRREKNKTRNFAWFLPGTNTVQKQEASQANK